MTIVDEWSKAETGVGADIAKMSQEEKGSCADLEKKMMKREKKKKMIMEKGKREKREEKLREK